jgi:hypothetical protein
VWRGAGSWSHAPGRCASATTRAADQPDQPHKRDKPDQARKPHADECFEPDARDSDQPDDPNNNEFAEPSAPALAVDESSPELVAAAGRRRSTDAPSTPTLRIDGFL